MATPYTPIIFTIARMNPPHLGHMLLVSELFADALEQNATNIYILLAIYQDAEDNPLDFSSNDPNTIDKKRLVSEMISNVKRQMAIENNNISYIEFKIICIDKYSSTPLYELMNSKPYNENVELRMIVGTDRFSFFDSFYSAFLLNNTPVNKIRIKFLKRSDDGSGVESMSATKIRNLVRDYKKASENNKPAIIAKLNKIYEGYVDPENIKLLVKVLSERLKDVPLGRKKASDDPGYPLAKDSHGILTEERGSKNWIEKMKSQIIIKINEAKNPNPNHDNIVDWLAWAIHSTAKV